MDIVVANGDEDNGDASVGVLLGKGDETFQSVVTCDSGATLSDYLAIANVNGDGNME